MLSQVKCFNAPLQPSEIEGVKNVVSEKMAEGVNATGLTLTGFLFLHALFIERGRLETTWTVLRKFGYDDEIKLRDDLLQSPSFKRNPDAVTLCAFLFYQLYSHSIEELALDLRIFVILCYLYTFCVGCLLLSLLHCSFKVASHTLLFCLYAVCRVD